MKKLLLFLILFTQTNQAQITHTDAVLYNVGTGGIVGGIGAIINKKKEDKIGKTFINGFWKGCLGGAIIYESKNLTSLIAKKERLEYNWLAKITNGIGASIVENGAQNKKAFEQININIGFNRIEIKLQKGINFNYKIMPVALVLTGYTAWDSKFEIEKTLQTGEFIFSKANLQSNNISTAGITYGVAIVLKSSQTSNYDIINHELIHVYQYMDFNGTNSFLKPLTSNFMQKLTRHIHIDFANALILRSFYLLQGNGTREKHATNYYENEARLFSN